MARRRFFVDEPAQGRAVIRGPQAHHLARVLRVEPGQVFELSDTHGLYLGRVAAATPREIVFAIEEQLATPPPLPEITLLASIFKFDRLEWMLEKVTELGASRIVPLIAARTERELARAAVRRVERWRRIVFEAAQQSRRMAPPELDEPQEFDAAVRSATASCPLMLDETSVVPWPPTPGPRPPQAAALLVGPEGGWTDLERRSALEARFQPVSLGPLILRAETAAVAALALLRLP